MKTTTSKKIKYGGVLWAIAFLLAAVAASVTSLFAWFADHSKVTVPDADFTITTESVLLGDEIKLTRTLLTAVNPFVQESRYFRNGDGYYLQNKALALDALTDGEQAVLTLKFKNTSSFTQFRVYLGGLTGDTVAAEGAETGTRYHVLGALKQSFRYYDKVLGETTTEESWLCDIAGVTSPQKFTLFTGDYTALEQDENGFVTVEIILKADYSRLQEAGVTRKALAGKKFRIGAIGVDCESKSQNNG